MARKARRFAPILALAILAGVIFPWPWPPALVRDGSILDVARGARVLVYTPGTVEHLVYLHKERILLPPRPPSDPFRIASWEALPGGRVSESWRLVGEGELVLKSHYREMAPDGELLRESFSDYYHRVEYDYEPELSPWNVVLRSTGGPWSLPSAWERASWLWRSGYQVVWRGEVMGYPAIAIERRWPLGREDLAWETILPLDFQAKDRADRQVLSVEPFGLYLAGEGVFVDVRGREFLESGSRLLRWELLPASAAPPKALTWTFPPGANLIIPELPPRGDP